MKWLAIGAAAAVSLGLSACAGSAGRNGIARSGSMDSDIDYGKVVAVNQWAERRHATVVWVNYPTRRSPRPSGT
ncbi:hypothetical protein [Dokdonella soli]|uniref:Uncharacterized protein n=1 Tax=Dokdonella soli TaxID=529810 RepID=A0ABP3TPS3_9GAMM